MHLCTAMCPVALDPASRLRRAPALPRAPRLWTLSLCSGGLQCCHMSHDSGPCLPIEAGSGAAMCPMAPDPASLLRRAPMLPCVT
jgi:hypothetical protein